MKRMTCPYCHSKVKIFEFQFRLTSYKCSNCQKVSKIRWKSRLFLPIIALFGGLGGMVFEMIFGTKPFIGKLGLSFVFAIPVVIGLTLVGRFVGVLDPITEEEQIDKPSSESDEVSQDQSAK